MDIQAELAESRRAESAAPAAAKPSNASLNAPAAAATALLAVGLIYSLGTSTSRPQAEPSPAASPAEDRAAAARTAEVRLPQDAAVLAPAIALGAQYEDGLVPLGLAAAALAAAGADSSKASAPAAGPLSRLSPYHGPSLLAQRPRQANWKRFGALNWFSSVAAPAAAAAAAAPQAQVEQGPAPAWIEQARAGAHDGLSDGMAQAWKKMSREQQEAWKKDWEKGAIESAKRQAAANGKTIARTDVVCVGHTDKCTFGELGVTYADGTHEVLKYDPLVFDLAGNGFKASRKETKFDLVGDRRLRDVADLPAGAGLLVFDANKDGVAGDSAYELFSAATDLDGDGLPDGFEDGFDAFNGLVKKALREGVLAPSAAGEMRLGPDDLAALERAYGLRIRTGGFHAAPGSLAAAGIAEVGLTNLGSVRQNSFDGQGTDIVRRPRAEFVRADGSRGEYADLFLSPRRLPQLAWAR